MAENPRKKAVKMLLDIEKNHSYVNIEMNNLRKQSVFSPVDVRFIGELVNGVIKRKITLDYVISKYSSTKLNKISPFVLAVLRTGIYQILYMDKVPASAAVNESVKIIKNSSVSRLSGYVNAVLRCVTGEEIKNLDLSDENNISVLHSMPLWIVRRWISTFGRDFAINLISSMNEKANVIIRRNPKVSSETLAETLRNEGINVSMFKLPDFPDFDYCFEIESMDDLITNTDSFKNGDFYIQDPAAALVSYILSPEPDDKIIDMCSAPGGKSIFASELMSNSGEIIAFDIYEHKLQLINDNIRRLSIKNIKAMLQDATQFNVKYENYADKIICDVPCSGLGIMRKKPDIRYSRNEEDISALSMLSLSILENASKYLVNGGTLVFSTCTIEPEENENTINEFLNKHREFKPFPFSKNGEYYKTFYPHIDKTDGFFVCRLKKAEE